MPALEFILIWLLGLALPTDVFVLIFCYALFCRFLWWNLKDWQDDKRDALEEAFAANRRRNPYPRWEPMLDARMRQQHEWEPRPWDL